MSSGNTGRAASRSVSAVSIVIRTPVRPIPALEGGRERERDSREIENATMLNLQRSQVVQHNADHV